MEDAHANIKFWLKAGVAILCIAILGTAYAGGWLRWGEHADTVTAVATCGTGVVLLVTGILILDGLTDARRTRHAQIVTVLSERWDSERLAESQFMFFMIGPPEIVNLLNRLYSPSSSRTLAELESDLVLQEKLFRLPNLIETMGAMHKTGIASTEVVYMIWGAGVIGWWREWKPLIELVRTLNRQPSSGKYFEQLAKDMRTYGLLQGDSFPLKPPAAGHPAIGSQAGEAGPAGTAE